LIRLEGTACIGLKSEGLGWLGCCARLDFPLDLQNGFAEDNFEVVMSLRIQLNAAGSVAHWEKVDATAMI
jgi:hypothetical protein